MRCKGLKIKGLRMIMAMGLAVVLVVVAIAAQGLTPQGTRGGAPDPASLIDPEAVMLQGDSTTTATGRAADASALTVAASPRPAITTYEIKTGDTIWDLASRFGVTVDSIIASNNLTSSGRVGPGQTIKIPAVSGLIVKVRSGESLWTLAQRYGLKTADVAAANGLDEQAALSIGQEILLPGARAISEPVQVASRGTSRPASSGSASSGSGSTGTSSSSSSNPSASGFIWPVRGPVTSSFGPRNGGTHTGIDIGVGTGTSVHASKAGKVTTAGWLSGYGNAVIISHGDGVTTLYAHNSKLLVKVGDSVDQGQVIALSGATGNATGPHVHFEIRINGQPINPRSRL